MLPSRIVKPLGVVSGGPDVIVGRLYEVIQLTLKKLIELKIRRKPVGIE